MRDKVFTMRLSEQERDKLRSLSSKLQLKPSEYLRGVINGDIHRELDDEKVQQKIREGLRNLS